MSSVFSTFPLPRTVAQGEMGCDDMIAGSVLTWSHSSGRKYIIVCKLSTSMFLLSTLSSCWVVKHMSSDFTQGDCLFFLKQLVVS